MAINLAKTCTVSFWLTVAVHRLLAYEADQVELVYALARGVWLLMCYIIINIEQFLSIIWFICSDMFQF